jgi:hypothetical protein
MLRKLLLPYSLLTCAVLSTASCEKGGTFDPLDNVPSGGSATQVPTPTIDLPRCDDTTPKPPCKIDIADLSFEVTSCNGFVPAGKGGTGTGAGWNHPGGASDKLQFGIDENGTLATNSCTMATQNCTIKLTKLPPAWNAIPATARVRLTYNQRYKLGDEVNFSGGMIDGTRLTMGVPQQAGRDLVAITGSRRDGSNLELHTTSLWFSLPADRTLSFTLRTSCFRTIEAAAYWYIEKMTAEALP